MSLLAEVRGSRPSPAVVRAVGSGLRRYRLPLLAVAALGELAAVYRLLTSGRHGFIDLDVYRLGVQAWLHGADPYGQLPPTQLGTRLPFIYPPFAAVLLSPLALVPWTVSAIATFTLTTVGLAVTLYLACRRIWPGGGQWGAVVLAALALPVATWLEPVRETYWFGQVNILLMVLVALDCLVERPRWPRGVLVGVAAAIKLTPAAFLLFFLVRRDVRAAVWTVIGGAAASLVGFLAAPSASVRYWFGGLAGASGVSGSPFATNQTLRGALARLDLPRAEQSALWLVLAALVVLAAWMAMRHAVQDGEVVLALGLNATAALLVSPTSWSHHWVWVAPALLAVLAHAVRWRSVGWGAAALAIAVVFSVGAHNFLPEGDGRELHWTPGQQLFGDSYVLLSVALLVSAAAAAVRAGRAAADPA
ncbi:membrane protein [Gandjariella thermophila]|uniref:Membrane protein n=1 Tax=Gandjariella thermophila TaxID=1931992 RepID=A0A4D4IX58_9PSEU|nr:membrane protein [Gandjariella thermophila]